MLLDPLFLSPCLALLSLLARTDAGDGKREANEARERASERAIEGTRDRVRDRPNDVQPTDQPTDRLTRASGGRPASPLPKKREGGPIPRMIEVESGHLPARSISLGLNPPGAI